MSIPEAAPSAARVHVEGPAPRYTWRRTTLHPERVGQACRVVEWSDGGKRVTVEFDDGLRAEVEANGSLRKIRQTEAR